MASSATTMTTTLGFLLLLTASSIVAICKSHGDDAAATIFVVLSYASLHLLFCCLRWFETAPPGPDGQSLPTKFAFAVLACGSALAIYCASGDDPASVLFVAATYLGLLLLLCCLRAFSRRHSTPGSPPPWERARHAVRALTTPLTRRCRTMDRQLALAMILFATPMCVLALAVHNVRADAVSMVLVFVSYAGLLTGVNLFFLGTFNDDNRDNYSGHGKEQEQGLGVGAHDAAPGHVRVEE